MADPLPNGFKEFAKESTTEDISFVDGSFKATRYFKGPWVDRFSFIEDYLFPEIVYSSNLTQYVLPGSYPDYQDAIVHTVKVTGQGVPTQAENGGPLWERALVEANYETPNFNVPKGNPGSSNDQDNFLNRVFLEESIDAHGEFVSVSKSQIKEKDLNKFLFKDGFFLLTTINATIVLRQVYIINPRWDVLPTLLGKVNSEPFITPAGFFCPKETLRYDGPFATTKVNVTNGAGEINGQDFPIPVWDISHRFEFKRTGWNKDIVDGKFVDIVLKKGQKPLFELADLRTIFFKPQANFDALMAQLQQLYADLQTELDAGKALTHPDVVKILDDINDILIQIGVRN